MIKDIMVYESQKYVCTIREDVDLGDGSMLQLLTAVLNEGLMGGRIIDILYVKDMDYGIVIPKHIADEMNAKVESIEEVIFKEDVENESRLKEIRDLNRKLQLGGK